MTMGDALMFVRSDVNPPTSSHRLLFIVPWMKLGGADRFNLLLLRELTQRGFAVTVCATIAGHHSWQTEFKRYTADVLILPDLASPENYPAYIANVMETRRIDTVL